MCLLPLLGGGAEIPQAVLPAGVGVNIHFVTGHEKDLGLIAKAGFKFVRMDFGWSAIEKRKGEYDWSGYEELVANLEKRGLRAIFILDYSHLLYEETVTSPNPITGEGQKNTASPQHPESIAAFGTVLPDLQPKPAYLAMKTLTHELSGYRIVRRIPLASDKDYVLLCAASTGGKKLVAWTLGEPHPANLPISLLGRNRLTAVAGDGTRFTPRIDSGRLLLDIGSAPQYLSLRGAVLK